MLAGCASSQPGNVTGKMTVGMAVMRKGVRLRCVHVERCSVVGAGVSRTDMCVMGSQVSVESSS